MRKEAVGQIQTLTINTYQNKKLTAEEKESAESCPSADCLKPMKCSRTTLKRCVLHVLLMMILCVSGVSVRADNEEYGKDAYQYLQYIDANLPYRITNQEMTGDTTGKTAAGEWIKNTMISLGYTPQIYSWTLVNDPICSYVFEKPGLSGKKLVIGAHYDCVDTKGVDDNGTGVSLLLELAARFADTPTNLTLEFAFWDGEETCGFAGSYDYLANRVDPSSILCYINLDTLGAGDRMYVYGGDYENGMLVRDWALNMAMDDAYLEHVTLNRMPQGIAKYPTPTRIGNSDQYYFSAYGIPYVYFEANAWITDSGEVGKPDVPQLYNSSLPAFHETGGQIIHTARFEDLATLESLVPGRIHEHLTAFSRVVSHMIRDMAEYSPAVYQYPIEHPEADASGETPGGHEDSKNGDHQQEEESNSGQDEAGGTEPAESREEAGPAAPEKDTETAPERTERQEDSPGIASEEAGGTSESNNKTTVSPAGSYDDMAPGSTETNRGRSRTALYLYLAAAAVVTGLLITVSMAAWNRNKRG